jgi:hypothetical protein
MATIDLYLEKLSSMHTGHDDVDAGTARALNAVRSCIDKSLPLPALESIIHNISHEHIAITIDSLNLFEQKLDRDQLLNQILAELGTL